jgi:hypothetical protein
MRFIPVIASVLLLLSGCQSTIRDYANDTPRLDMRRFFNGDLEVWGEWFQYEGHPRFHMRMSVAWAGDDGTVTEDYTYGEWGKGSSTWKLHFTDDHHFTATSDEMVGVSQGEQYGNAMHLRYTLHHPGHERHERYPGHERHEQSRDIAMDEWFYLIDDDHMIGHLTSSVHGVVTGHLEMGVRKIR